MKLLAKVIGRLQKMSMADKELMVYSIFEKKLCQLFYPWEIFHAFLSSADFFQNEILEKFFLKYHQCQIV